MNAILLTISLCLASLLLFKLSACSVSLLAAGIISGTRIMLLLRWFIVSKTRTGIGTTILVGKVACGGLASLYFIQK